MPYKLMRLPELLTKIGYSRASVYKLIAEGSFPKPILLGKRAVAWNEEAVDDWILSRINAPSLSTSEVKTIKRGSND